MNDEPQRRVEDHTPYLTMIATSTIGGFFSGGIFCALLWIALVIPLHIVPETLRLTKREKTIIKKCRSSSEVRLETRQERLEARQQKENPNGDTEGDKRLRRLLERRPAAE